MGAIMQSILYPSEVGAMLDLKFGGHIKKVHKEPLEELAKTLDNSDFCYAVLNRVSRSFAVVIQTLPIELRDAVCIFYLVLRGLDSVEDDMTFDVKKKIPLLIDFHNKLDEDGWCIEGVGDSPDYRVLMAHFGKVITVFKSLDQQYIDVIKNITMLMGQGMADFADKIGSIPTTEEYDLYCHHVAGLVGWGLSGLFSGSGLEDPNLTNEKVISNSMGLFLQKTNIIRDFLEDLEEGRTWWPKDIWENYGESLNDFKDQPYSDKSIACLNHMVANALLHVPDCLDYMSRLKNEQIFAFCAIPQIMAIATLEKVYNNPKVFQGNVKVRKGLSCKMMLNCKNMKQLNNWFGLFASKMKARRNKSDPHAKQIDQLLTQIQLQAPTTPKLSYVAIKHIHMFSWLMLFILIAAHFVGFIPGQEAVVACCSTTQMVGGVLALAALANIYGFFGMIAF